jgi:hypothetical protein
MAGTTRLELATSAVTGQRSNQLNYVPAYVARGRLRKPPLLLAMGRKGNGDDKWWAVQDSNLRPSRCKRDALTN